MVLLLVEMTCESERCTFLSKVPVVFTSDSQIAKLCACRSLARAGDVFRNAWSKRRLVQAAEPCAYCERHCQVGRITMSYYDTFFAGRFSPDALHPALGTA